MPIRGGVASRAASTRLRVSLLVALLLAVVTPVLGPVCASAASAAASATATSSATSTSSARSLLFGLTVKAESGNSTYRRTYFKLWVDADRDCQNTRTEVLIAESRVALRYATSRHCAVASGKWASAYDGATWTRPADVDIDHLVPLKEAWRSGAWRWSANNRMRYANDLGFAASLQAVTDHVNQAKGDKDPAQWLPPLKGARCAYATAWVQVKYRWRLSIDSAERSRLSSILTGSCGSRPTTVPARGI
ncbi:MAG TPA: HNH endonuclease family protein [Dermatophilaceae bacterium]